MNSLFFSDDENLRARALLGLGWTGQAFLEEMALFQENHNLTLNRAYVDLRTPYKDRCIIYGCVALADPDYYKVKINKKIRFSHLEAARRAIRRQQDYLLKNAPLLQ